MARKGRGIHIDLIERLSEKKGGRKIQHSKLFKEGRLKMRVTTNLKDWDDYSQGLESGRLFLRIRGDWSGEQFRSSRKVLAKITKLQGAAAQEAFVLDENTFLIDGKIYDFSILAKPCCLTKEELHSLHKRRLKTKRFYIIHFTNFRF